MINQEKIGHCNNHLTSAAHCEFDLFLDLIRRASNRIELLAVFHDLPKFQSIAEPVQLYLLTQTFLRKLTPPIFGYISEVDFNTLFRDALFLRSSNPVTSFWALICSLSQCDDNGSFHFSKCIALVAKVQRELLLRALLTNSPNSEDAYQFAFVLSSFASRVYNFFAKFSHLRHSSSLCEHSSHPISADALDRAAAIVANFEQNLLAVLLEVAGKPPSAVDMAMFTHILTEYGAASAGGEEFIRRFISVALCTPKMHSILHQIFAPKSSGEFFHRAESRRNWETMLLIFVAMATNGQSLQLIFGDSLLSNASLRRFLIERAALVSPPSFAGRRPRNSEKVADCLALCAPAHSVAAFQTHVQLFVDRCKIVEMTSLHSHFAQALAVVDFARRLDLEQRCSVRDQLMYSLVPFVSQMIEIVDCSRRQIGMLMAEELFVLFDFPSPPKFDYVETDPMLREFRMALQQPQNQNVIGVDHMEENSERRDSKWKQRTAGDARVALLLDSDDDEEAQEGGMGIGCDLEEEDVPSSLSDRPVYLRDCLEFLFAATDDQSAKMCHWVGALRAIPTLLRKRSVGWNTLSEELMEMVIQLDNRYNMPDFLELQTKILELLLALSPELVSNAFRKITSRCCPMSRRFLLLSAVVNAAKMLTNGEENGTAGGKLTKIEQTVDFDANEGQKGEKKACKEIRRSKTLKKEHINLHENGFLRVAPQFVFPLLDFIQFDHFYGVAQSNVFLGKLALALGELVSCAAHAPSILCILSASFAWLAILRRVGAPPHPFVRRCCICAYLAICDSLWPSLKLLREHFADELRDCREWLEETATTDAALGEVDETGRQCIGLLSLKIAYILSTF